MVAKRNKYTEEIKKDAVSLSYHHKKQSAQSPKKQTDNNAKNDREECMHMKEISLVDYMGFSDLKGNLIGHSSKVLIETVEMLEDYYKINLFITHNYKERLLNDKSNTEIIYLKHFYIEPVINFSIRIRNIIGRLINLLHVFYSDKSTLTWFISVDFALFAIIFLMPVKKKNIVLTLYQEFKFSRGIKDKIREYIFKNVLLNKVNLIVITNENLRDNYISNKTKSIFIPDYVYFESDYKKYEVHPKKKQVIIVGLITKSKELSLVIDIFKSLDISLKIMGLFYDKKEFDFLNKGLPSHIELQDVYLEEREYYSIIAESSFILLPYNRNYENKTSGILIESMFLDTIPIAPYSLLQFNKIPGLSYLDTADIAKIDFNNIDYEKYYKAYKKLKNNKYSKENNLIKLLSAFNRLSCG